MTPIIYLYKSDKPSKKFYIQYINPTSGRLKKTYFGASNYEDYTIHKNSKRKMLYLKRHSGMNEDYSNIYSAGALARALLWNQKTLEASILDTNEKYGVKIIKQF